MSNHLAIATVSAALGELARRAAQSGVTSNLTVHYGRPVAPTGNEADTPHLFVYLYQVTPNAALRNADLPLRTAEGRLSRRPQAALDLHYLLVFYGDDQQLEPARMLGAVVRDLHARPLLDGQLIQEIIAAGGPLTDSDMAAAVERVRFTQTSLSIDELSKLWSVMAQTPHALSIAYQGSVILIDGLESGTGALPVLRRGQNDGIDTRLGPFPRLDSFWAGSAASPVGPARPPSLPAAQMGSMLVLEGANLAGEGATLSFSHPGLGATVIDVPAADISDRQLRFTWPDDAAARSAWAAGIYSVYATIRRATGNKSSNSFPLALAPRLVSIQPNPAFRTPDRRVTLTLTCRPNVLSGQSVSLLLADREISAEPLVAAGDTLVFVIDSAPAMEAETARLRVGGVESLPFAYDPAIPGFKFDPQQRVKII